MVRALRWCAGRAPAGNDPELQVEADSPLNNRMVATHGLTSQQLEKELSVTGWTFFLVAGPIHMTAFGSDRDRTLYALLKRVIKAVKKQSCNCLQVESVDMHSFLGIAYKTLSGRPLHIQKGLFFVGLSVGDEEGFSAPEARRRAVTS